MLRSQVRKLKNSASHGNLDEMTSSAFNSITLILHQKSTKIDLVHRSVGDAVGEYFGSVLSHVLVASNRHLFAFTFGAHPSNCEGRQKQPAPAMTTNIATTSTGAPIPEYGLTSSQTAGPQGPMVLQDFIYLDHLPHFDRERIPERVVHAKGAGRFAAPNRVNLLAADLTSALDLVVQARSAILK